MKRSRVHAAEVKSLLFLESSYFCSREQTSKRLLRQKTVSMSVSIGLLSLFIRFYHYTITSCATLIKEKKSFSKQINCGLQSELWMFPKRKLADVFYIANQFILMITQALLAFWNLWLPFRSWKDFSDKLLAWREEEPCRHSTFLYSQTIGAVEAFHLSSSCWKIRPFGLITSTSTVYLYFSSNQNQLHIFFRVLLLLYNLHRHLCANAVIDKFITSKGIQFSFQSCSGMNRAASSVANNKAPLPKLGLASSVLPGESVSDRQPPVLTGEDPISLSNKCHFAQAQQESSTLVLPVIAFNAETVSHWFACSSASFTVNMQLHLTLLMLVENLTRQPSAVWPSEGRL